LMDITGVRSSAFMLMYGVVWVSLIWMYFTEVRRTEVMGAAAPEGPSLPHLHPRSPSPEMPASMSPALQKA
jgi:MFS transporter, NNP family, nitrate/nitrite transporter